MTNAKKTTKKKGKCAKPSPATDVRTLSPQAAAVLVRLLGAVDAIFRPWRRAPWDEHEGRARDYPTAGVPWRSGGGEDDAARKASQRALEELAAAGLVRVLRGDSRAVGVVLTEAGDVAAREAVGHPGIEQARELVRRVVALAEELGDGEELVAEVLLTVPARPWGSHDVVDLAQVEIVAAAAVAEGWLQWEANGMGHVFYRATAAGRREASKEAGRWAGAELFVWPEATLPGLDGVFLEAWKQARREIAEAPRRQDLGRIPLPIGRWTSESWRRFQAALVKYGPGGVSP